MIHRLFGKLLPVCAAVLAAFTGCSDDGQDPLVMVCEATFPPYEYHVQGGIDGIDAALAGIVAKCIGRELEVQDMAFDAVIPAVATGKADIAASGITVTEERKKQVLFSAPYVEAGQVVIVREDSPILRPSEISGLRIGVQSGTTGDLYVTKTIGREPERYQNVSFAAKAVQSGKVDAAIVDKGPAEVVVAAEGGLRILPEPATTERYAFAFAKKNRVLQAQTSAVFNVMRETGDLRELTERYNEAMRRRKDGADAEAVRVDVSDIAERVAANPKLREQLRATEENLTIAGGDGCLDVICEAAFPPYEFHGRTGIEGIDPALMRIVADALGLRLDIQDSRFSAVIPAVVQGKADVVASGLTVTEERAREVLFSDPYVSAYQVAVVPRGSPLQTPEDIRRLRIGIQLGSSADTFLTKDGRYPNLERFESVNDAVSAILTGKVDCAVIDEQPARVFASKNAEAVRILREPVTREDYAMAFSKESALLCAKVNAVLAYMRRTTLPATGRSLLDEVIHRYASAMEQSASQQAQDAALARVRTQDIHDAVLGDEAFLERLAGVTVARGAGFGLTERIRAGWRDFCGSLRTNFVDEDRWVYLLNGFAVTLEISFLAVLIGLVLGFAVAVIRATHDTVGGLRAANALCKVYLTVIRGTPVVVQLLIIYFVIFGSVNVSKVLVAVIAFGFNSGAYVSEIIRAGIMSIDKGQSEAGRSLGLGYLRTMGFIILPQAFRNVLPALGNEFIVLLKETSVAGYIALMDLTKAGDIIRSQTYTAFLPLLAVAAIYLAVVSLFSMLLGRLERRLKNNG